MFIPHPFFLASPYNFTKAPFKRLESGGLTSSHHLIDECSHQSDLEWIIDFDEYHVENVDVRDTESNVLWCCFNFQHWGYDYTDWRRFITEHDSEDESTCISFTLSLRIFGFLIDAWEFTDALILDQCSGGNGRRISLKVDIDSKITQVKQLPRVNLHFTVKSITSFLLRGESEISPMTYCLNVSTGLDYEQITPRQFLLNYLKQRQRTTVF